MLQKRQFNIVVVSKGQPTTKTVEYNGQAMNVKF